MIVHLANSRGHANHGWLDSHHTFSFADYYHPERMGFGALRVINDDTVAPGMGFCTHPHRDMEIISIPLEGSLQHRDSEGNSSVIKKGEIQVMSAGSGITHSELNASPKEAVRFLQIWVKPNKFGIRPSYGQKTLNMEGHKNQLSLIVSPDGREGSLSIHQNAFFSLSKLEQNKSIQYKRQAVGNGLYVFVISGEIICNEERLNCRDGAALKDFENINIIACQPSEILLMEIPV